MTAFTRLSGLESGSQGFGLADNSVAGEWRLPTKTELDELFNGPDQVRSNQEGAFTGVQTSYYWSSTEHANDAGRAWRVYLSGGSVHTGAKSSTYYVWPVRSRR